MIALRDEHRKRIESLYLEMFDKLMIYARSTLENEALAEEAVQDTFRIACQNPEKLCQSPNPQGWLVLTLRNTIRNTLSNRATAKRIAETYLMHHLKEVSFSEGPMDLTLQYRNLVNTEEFELLLEMAIEGKSHKEMAAARNISVVACRKRVQRAREILQKKIKE